MRTATEIEEFVHQRKEIELKWRDTLGQWDDEVAETFGQVVINPLEEAIATLVERLSEDPSQ